VGRLELFVERDHQLLMFDFPCESFACQLVVAGRNGFLSLSLPKLCLLRIAGSPFFKHHFICDDLRRLLSGIADRLRHFADCLPQHFFGILETLGHLMRFAEMMSLMR
jgi:hypothetical protein